MGSWPEPATFKRADAVRDVQPVIALVIIRALAGMGESRRNPLAESSGAPKSTRCLRERPPRRAAAKGWRRRRAPAPRRERPADLTPA